MKIRVDAKLCTGCHLCEMACSLFHIGEVNLERSAIVIFKDDLGASINHPKVCPQCKKMVCLNAPQDAGVDEEVAKKEWEWPAYRVDFCRPDQIFEVGEFTYHCDLCGGDPQCVKYCTTKAIWVG